jgi:hypothetical protein
VVCIFVEGGQLKMAVTLLGVEMIEVLMEQARIDDAFLT